EQESSPRRLQKRRYGLHNFPNGIERFRDGQPVNGDKEAELSELLKATDIPVEIHMGLGDGCYDLRASDLGHEYVSLNADYRS
ncbi:bifunctional ornithine acetyltransferase/N-acetylglutamate synthase, partial [Desulfovibrio sp.]|uniref:bifunctional ornithine acetyltransferase/N-acetylglutamate synthase n=1 Tax=Desulfovibrio sp. TaxID=885 RepID=UPI003FF1158A